MKCPRCDSDQVKKLVDSPVGNVWEVYICDHCGYSWRSTEDISIDPKFKLTDEKIANLTENPPVPPLDK